MFPPGLARLATKPLPTGSSSLAMTMGIVEVAAPDNGGSTRPGRDNHVYLESHKLLGEGAAVFSFVVRAAPFDQNILPLHVPQIPQAFPERLLAGCC